MEKLNEVKETYAKELGYKDWETCINDQPNYKVETLMDEVALRLYSVSNRAISMEEILNEAQRRKAKHSVQYADYSLDTWTVANDLLEHRKKALLADGSVRKVRIEYEM